LGGLGWDLVGSGGIWWWEPLISPDPGNLVGFGWDLVELFNSMNYHRFPPVAL
jgi:hypothetical protein